LTFFTATETNQIKIKDMRKLFKPFVIATLSIFIISSCSKEKQEPTTELVSEETIAKIAKLGYGTSEVQKIDEGYLVEGDIILTEKNLNEIPSSPVLRIANVEQYRTNNLVTALPRTITVSTNSTNANLSNAINNAIARYNAQSLRLTFQRVSSGGDIAISVVNTRQYIASAGFPTSGGDPYGSIKYAKAFLTYSSGFMTSVIAHEMGHCIGFRHTDYMDRSYSCGGSTANEGASTVGAVYIPGTAVGTDPNSWMLACLSATTDRPFNANDRTALDYLYK
jgi:Dual-action HEIGH metallo-peptidase